MNVFVLLKRWRWSSATKEVQGQWKRNKVKKKYQPNITQKSGYFQVDKINDAFTLLFAVSCI